MKKNLVLLTALTVGLTLCSVSAPAQQRPGPGGPYFDSMMAKFFGDNKGFSATMLCSTTMPNGNVVMPGKIAFLDGKSRFEMDMSQMQGGAMPPGALAQMKQMGMDKMATLSLPDKRQFIIYPNLKAYVQAPVPPGGAPSASDFKSETTKLGTETVHGHDCVKNKVVMTGPDGVAHESTIWNANDLNKFPVKIEMTVDQGVSSTLEFSDIKLAKPDAAQFDPPAGYTKYDNMMALMMSRMKNAQPPQ